MHFIRGHPTFITVSNTSSFHLIISVIFVSVFVLTALFTQKTGQHPAIVQQDDGEKERVEPPFFYYDVIITEGGFSTARDIR